MNDLSTSCQVASYIVLVQEQPCRDHFVHNHAQHETQRTSAYHDVRDCCKSAFEDRCYAFFHVSPGSRDLFSDSGRVSADPSPPSLSVQRIDLRPHCWRSRCDEKQVCAHICGPMICIIDLNIICIDLSHYSLACTFETAACLNASAGYLASYLNHLCQVSLSEGWSVRYRIIS